MTFIDDDFMLDTEQAKALYHDYAKDLPIIDYHCHLPPEQVGENTQFDNLYQVWLAGDHYKWRAMRTNGVSEHYCTGDASDWEKFQKWADTVPYTLRNPCTTGLTLSCANLLALPTAYSARKPPKVFGMSVMKNSPRRSSARAD